MDMAVADHLSVLRTFAFATDAPYALQTLPGVYNEDVFRGLDYTLDQARQRGIKVGLPLQADQRAALAMLCLDTQQSCTQLLAPESTRCDVGVPC